MEEREELIQTLRVIFAIIVGLVMLVFILLIIYGVVIAPYLRIT
jgi:hypothetical protein